MKKNKNCFLLLSLIAIFFLGALCLVAACTTTKGAGGYAGGEGEEFGQGGSGFSIFGGSLPINTSELIGGIVILVIILVSVIIIRQIVSRK
jgi:hypothetical protein